MKRSSRTSGLSRLRTRVRAGILAWLLSAMLPAVRAPAHQFTGPGPVVAGHVIINRGEVEVEIFLGLTLVERNIGLRPGNDRSMSPEDLLSFRSEVEKFFEGRVPVTIDGRKPRPRIKRLRLDPTETSEDGKRLLLKPETALVVMRSYPLKSKPRSISIVWDLFPAELASAGEIAAGVATEIPVLVLSPDQPEQLAVFTREEPEFVWHPRDLASLAGRETSRGRARDEPGGPRRTRVPLIALALLGASVVAVVLTLRGAPRSARRRRGLALVAVLVLLAAATSPLLFPVSLPWATRIRPPGKEEARRIFASLLRNIYHAFDYTNESDIYDTLSRSVEGKLLDEIYREVYGSLILREQGGAVSKVRKVEVLQCRLRPEASSGELPPDAFAVDARWRVHGFVKHWNHVHTRTNEYTARYTIAARDDDWRVIGQDVLSEEQVGSSDPAGVSTGKGATGLRTP